MPCCVVVNYIELPSGSTFAALVYVVDFDKTRRVRLERQIILFSKQVCSGYTETKEEDFECGQGSGMPAR